MQWGGLTCRFRSKGCGVSLSVVVTGDRSWSMCLHCGCRLGRSYSVDEAFGTRFQLRHGFSLDAEFKKTVLSSTLAP
jgi:hypothetical protein